MQSERRQLLQLQMPLSEPQPRNGGAELDRLVQACPPHIPSKPYFTFTYLFSRTDAVLILCRHHTLPASLK